MFLQKVGFSPYHKHKQHNKGLGVVENHFYSDPVPPRLSCQPLPGDWQWALSSRPYDGKAGKYAAVLWVPVEVSEGSLEKTEIPARGSDGIPAELAEVKNCWPIHTWNNYVLVSISI